MVVPLMVLLAGASGQSGNDFCKVQLLSEVKSYQVGKPFTVGLKFRMTPGWHIYWRNPGDSGQEVKVDWTLPKGWKAGPLLWTRPKVFVDADLVNYGYDGERMLLAEITPSKTTGTIKASVEWLVCSKETCLQGDQVLQAKLIAAPTPVVNADTAASFQVAKGLLPTRLSGKAEATANAAEIVLRVQMPATEGATYTFLPHDSSVVSNEQPQSVRAEDGWIEFKLKKSRFGNGVPKRLTGEFAITQPAGTSAVDTLFAIDVPLVQRSGERK